MAPLSSRAQDRLARGLITVGGVGLVLIVAAILIFIVREAEPLARSASITEETPALPTTGVVLVSGIDDYLGIAMRVHADVIRFTDVQSGQPVAEIDNPFGETPIVAASFDPRGGKLPLAAADGRLAYARVVYRVQFSEGSRTVTPQVRVDFTSETPEQSADVLEVVGDRNEDGEVVLVARQSDDRLHYLFVDEDQEVVTDTWLETRLEQHQPTAMVVSLLGGFMAIGTEDGTLFFWKLGDPEDPEVLDRVRVTDAPVTALASLLGDESLIVGGGNGAVSQWFPVRYVEATNSGDAPVDLDGETVPAHGSRVLIDRDYGSRYSHRADLRFTTAGTPWTRIRNFDGVHDSVLDITVSPRNKGFAVLDASGHIALMHATSHRTLEVLDTGLDLRGLTFAPRANGLVAMDVHGKQHLWKVDNPHPEAGWQAFFGKVWYEGYSQEKYVWQSTGGSVEFEPKLSLMPLLLGTLKGTLYAMLFSVPISILAALYVSQLAAPGLRTIVKPVVELMAAIPTVVVGFLAALWLAPRIEKHLAQVFLGNLFVPLGVVVALVCWHLIPREKRSRAIPGIELIFVVPFLIAAVWLGVKLASPMEHAWFAGDLRQWLFDQLGFSYDQRNCIVVGIGLGYAVIPIIFSISEDALSSVPPSLTTASLALGASPWQTALHVILPAASPGIFAAVMLGLGRAIGETMIVLMATGNTPVMDLSIFNGMRTMSAAIAVEIPEAPHGGTLYRVLFLTGSLLFLITFIINTLADQVSRLLRKRYAQF